METSSKEMTPERSLQIISETIEQSRRAITKNSWKPMLLWGVSVTIIALVVGHLWEHTSMGTGANGLWGLLGVVSLVERLRLKGKPTLPETFVSKTIRYTWNSLGIMAGSLGFFAGILLGIIAPRFPELAQWLQESGTGIPITAIIIMLMGIAGMITGRILDSNIITVCCFLSGFLGFFFALPLHNGYQMLVMAGAGILGLIVPALIIKQKEEA